MQHKPKLSIIVCIYAQTSNLDAFIHNIITQDFLDFELIIMNICQSGTEKKLVDSYIKSDKRIHYIYNDKFNLFLAREFACKYAHSDYIIFCNPEDRLLPNAINILYSMIILKKVDLIIARQYDVVDGIKCIDKSIINILEKYHDIPFSIHETNYELFESKLNLEAKIFKKELLLICFSRIKKIYRYVNDNVLLCLYYSTSKKISLIYDYVYKHNNKSVPYLERQNFILERINTFKQFFTLCNEFFILPNGAYYTLTCNLLNFVKRSMSNNKGVLFPKKQDFIFLKNFVDNYKTISAYLWIIDELHPYKTFFKKLFRIEKGTKKIYIYLFNIRFFSLIRFSYLEKIRKETLVKKVYILKLKKLCFDAAFRRISICFYVNQKQKWQSELLLKKFAASDRYNISFVFYPNPASPNSNDDYLFYKSKGFPIFMAEKTNPNDFDIVFYQQPWCIIKNWKPSVAYKYALLCYIPYCVYSLVSPYNYIKNFHPYLWKQFSDYYQDSISFHNKIFLGSLKVEELHNYLINRECSNDLKVLYKKTIVYAPHHSFAENSHNMSTWIYMGEFILNFANKYKDHYNWIFRPHPRFKHELRNLNILTDSQIDYYFDSWSKIGTVDEYSCWQELLSKADILITDSISFLYDFAVTGKPLIHLLSLRQRDAFTDKLDQIINGYYSVYTLEQLQDIFDKVIVKSLDSKKKLRERTIKESDFIYSYSASDNIYNYFNMLFHLKK